MRHYFEERIEDADEDDTIKAFCGERVTLTAVAVDNIFAPDPDQCGECKVLAAEYRRAVEAQS